MKLGRRSILLALALAGALAAPASGQEQGRPSPPRSATEERLLQLNSEVARTVEEIKESLGRLLAINQQEVERAARQVELRAPLRAKGYVSRLEFEESERALAAAEAAVEETRRQLAQTNMALAEVNARAQLGGLAALATGAYREESELILYYGGVWSLADAGKIETFFAQRFGRLLPVSARGQTALHSQMKFDHSNAMDVALHPDSSEGRALIDYLRKAGIPFVAFRERARGVSTGAHIHIGRPSLRLAAR
ncbi:MAG: hypothetical protein A3F90_10970 [Deltaproteobacteria bacterium RIFCSPLOWO2_12_FULL_60_19]|nr:MAG: hypothetical protein A3F90_10970 [Deltaproteobacteria bacterium RIFCSPLOWO2_12_FULL_60_19]